MDKIQILQLGAQDWREQYSMPEFVEFHYMKRLDLPPDELYDLVFLERTPSDEEARLLHRATKAYTLYVLDQVELKGKAEWLYKCKKGKRIAENELPDFFLHEARNYFPKPYGEKFQSLNISIAQGFPGSVKWNGNYSVCLEGEFGEEFSQAVFWRNNIPLDRGQCLDLWLEYKKDSDVSIILKVVQITRGSHMELRQRWEFSEEALNQVVSIDNQLEDGLIFASVLAKGAGQLQIIGLHDRYSRRGHGYFLPGGERYVSSDREEVFCYFDPGDMKPPLNVYFSGYKTLEGFEGYNLMRSMGCPFLLIAEARLEGGSFYMGTEEYEGIIPGIIRSYMEELAFTTDQVIFSGLSMGTFGALYYGCDMKPYAIILGKPLASIGDVAANEKRLRPGGFPTSLDVLWSVCKNTDQAAIDQMNQRFWNKFDAADWGKTKFLVAYMIEDDYDATAYERLISHLQWEGAKIYGKGLHGRHNDDSPGIVSWFSSQLKKTIKEDFREGQREL